MTSRRVGTVYAIYTSSGEQPVTLVKTEEHAKEMIANLNKLYPHKKATYVPMGVFD